MRWCWLRGNLAYASEIPHFTESWVYLFPLQTSIWPLTQSGEKWPLQQSSWAACLYISCYLSSWSIWLWLRSSSLRENLKCMMQEQMRIIQVCGDRYIGGIVAHAGGDRDDSIVSHAGGDRDDNINLWCPTLVAFSLFSHLLWHDWLWHWFWVFFRACLFSKPDFLPYPSILWVTGSFSPCILLLNN